MYRKANHCILFLIFIMSISCIQPSKGNGAANYPLEIIAPRAGLNINNRYYRAYPGLPYEVNVAVIGGGYPFTYQLTTAPSGMSINSSTGLITWSNPSTSVSPATVTVKVTDSSSNTASVTWAVTVTTAGFIFVDSANGTSRVNGGTGTISNPFKTTMDWYISNTDSTYVNYFVYLKNGTYNMSGVSTSDGNWRSVKKPQVYLAYPGNTPTWDFSAARIYEDYNSENWYMDGITISGCSSLNQQIRLSSGSNDQQFRKCTFTNFPGAGEGSNASCVFIDNGGTGNYKVFIGNTFTNINSGYGILLYNTNKSLIADNTFTAFTNTLSGAAYGIGPKCGNTNLHIRNNSFSNLAINTVGLHAMYCGASQGSWPNSGNFEISYNNFKGGFSGSSMTLGDSDTSAGGPIYSFRNTFTSPVSVYIGANTGPFYFYNNAIQNSTSGDHIGKSGSNTSNCIVSNNLSGNSGIADSNGLLINRAYVGTYGWETNSFGIKSYTFCDDAGKCTTINAN